MPGEPSHAGGDSLHAKMVDPVVTRPGPDSGALDPSFNGLPTLQPRRR